MDKKAKDELLEKAVSKCPEDKSIICIRDRNAYKFIGEDKENDFEVYLHSLISGELDTNMIVASFRNSWCLIAFKKDCLIDIDKYEQYAFKYSSLYSCHISYF